MELPVKNLQGEVISTAELDERVWDIRPNVAVAGDQIVPILAAHLSPIQVM